MSDGHCLCALSAGADSCQLFVAVLTQDRATPPRLTIRVGGGEVDLSARHWQATATGHQSDRVWWMKPVIQNLVPQTRYEATLVDADGTVLTTAALMTLPAHDCHRLRLTAGSCFDIGSRHAWVLGQALDALLPTMSALPTYNVWLGDQVYVDAPWSEATHASDARKIIFNRYLRTWGITATSGLARAMQTSSNWYIPDDHEFWNGYPDPSWLTLFWHTFKRVTKQLWRARPMSNSLPHPSSQGEWGAAAGEAYCVFETEHEFEHFGETISPRQLQMIETDDVVVVLVDTRWRRTIRKSLPGAGFMLDADLEQLEALLKTDERLVCLAIAKPLVGYLPRRTVGKGEIDCGAEAFPTQYTRLWSALDSRRSARRPTITIAGDVHRHAVRSALDGALLEIVSSPLALLDVLDPESGLSRTRRTLAAVRTGASRVWGGIRRIFVKTETAIRRIDADVPNAFPRFDASGEWSPVSGTEISVAAKGASGLASIELDTSSVGAPVVVLRTVIESLGPLATGVTSATSTFRWQSSTGWTVDAA